MKNSCTSERLKMILSERGLKQVDILRMCEPLCKKMNVRLGRNDLSQYISGKAIPKQDKLSVLSVALNVSEPWLMGYDVPMERTYVNVSELSDVEMQLIIKYRSNPQMQEAVHKLLGIE